MRYQRGSVRRVGDSWEWRYRIQGVMKQESFPVADFPTESHLWTHLESAIADLNRQQKRPTLVSATMGDLAKKYKDEYLPKLAKSTQDTDTSTINVHILPKWEKTKLSNVAPGDVESWLESLDLSPSSRARTRRTLKQMFDRAMVWKMYPIGTNPMTLVKVRGGSKRKKKPLFLTPEQVSLLASKLPQPYSRMVVIAAGLGLRVSEVVALQWKDINWKAKTLTINRAFTHSALKEAKTEASAATLPVAANLISLLKEQKKSSGDSEWVFPSPVTGHPYSADTILAKKIKPLLKELKLPAAGWHTMRHSYRAWLGGTDAKVSQMKDLMRHGDIGTTFDYGGTPVEEMRPLHEAVASRLKIKRPVSKRADAAD